MTSQLRTTAPSAEIRMGHGLAAPERATPAPTAHPDDQAPSTAVRRRRQVLVVAAFLSPLGLAAQYALDAAGLPRQDAETYLTAVAAAPGRTLASTIAYGIGITTMLAVAAVGALALRRSAPWLSAGAAALLGVGAVGAGGFVGLRLSALALVADGRPVEGGVAAFEHLQAGVIDRIGIVALGAALGTLVLAAAMVRARREIGWWPAPVWVLGFVLASGEFPTAVSVAGALLGAAPLVPLARLVLRRSS